MKYAVYVEGLSELLFVADILQKYSDYNPESFGFLCINLNADEFVSLSYPKQGNESSANYYQIVNVNNDNRVISKLNKDIPGLLAQGFDVLIGLKDVFGDAYEQLSGGQPIVDRTLINQLYSIQSNSINSQGSDCRLHFAIMEYEAWMMGLIDSFVANKGKDIKELCDQIGIDPTADAESTFYHPYTVVRKIYQFCGEDYHKHGKEAHSFLSYMTKDDYERLRYSNRCASFAKFIDSLLGGACPSLP